MACSRARSTEKGATPASQRRQVESPPVQELRHEICATDDLAESSVASNALSTAASGCSGKTDGSHSSSTNLSARHAIQRGRPLVFAEVNIAPGRPPERLVLYANQSAADAAAEFAMKHKLAAKLAGRLCALLQDLLAKPGLDAAPPAAPPAA